MTVKGLDSPLPTPTHLTTHNFTICFCSDDKKIWGIYWREKPKQGDSLTACLGVRPVHTFPLRWETQLGLLYGGFVCPGLPLPCAVERQECAADGKCGVSSVGGMRRLSAQVAFWDQGFSAFQPSLLPIRYSHIPLSVQTFAGIISDHLRLTR